MRKQTYPNQPTDDVLEVIEKLVELKRQGKFEDVNQEYFRLAAQEKNDAHNYPYVLKSWAKVLICLGEYEKAIDHLDKAAKLFQNNGNNIDSWQCFNQAKKIRNRDQDSEDFIDYVRALSGGSLDYPNNFSRNTKLSKRNFSDAEINAIQEILAAPDINTLSKLSKQHSTFDHPFFKGIIGKQYFEKFKMVNQGLKYFAYSARYGIKFPIKFWYASYIDGISQSLTQIFLDAINISEEDEIALKLFYLDYIYLSAVIDLMPNTAHDSYDLRARLLRKYGNFRRIMVSTYLSLFSIPEVLILADYYFASQAFYLRNFKTYAQYAYEAAQNYHFNLEDISVAGKSANEYKISEIAEIGKKRHEDLSYKMITLGMAGKFDIEDSDYIEFVKKLKFKKEI